jgi:hypothetical protein
MNLRAWICVCLFFALLGVPSCGHDAGERQSAPAAVTTLTTDQSPTAAPGSRLAKLRGAVEGCSILVLDDDFDVLASLREREDIEGFFAMIEINAAKSGCVCRCLGEPFVTFVRADEQIVASLRIHHGHRLSWDGWVGQSYLTERSSFLVGSWLAERGFPGPLADAEAKKRKDIALGRPW